MTTENMTASVMEQFAQKIDNDTEYTVSELKKVLTEVYKNVQLSIAEKKKAEKLNNGDKPRKVRTKRERDENGDIIKKRAPSAYNLFIKDQSAIIKQTNPGLDPKTIFKMAIVEWKNHKLAEEEANEPIEPVLPSFTVIKHVNAEPGEDTINPIEDDCDKLNEVSQPAAIIKPKKLAMRKPKQASAADNDEM
jgi:hypothetical protein